MAGGIVGRAQAVAAYMTSSDIRVRPLFSKSYDPFDVRLVGYDVASDGPARIKALEDLRTIWPRGDLAEINKMVLFLMANTKRREEHDMAEKLHRSGLCAVAAEYPVVIVSEVIENWYKREGPQAIFTPTQAELFRALEDAAAPIVLLERELERRIDGESHGNHD